MTDDVKTVQYFYIEFQYSGKEKASIFSGDFVLPTGSKWHEIEARAALLFTEFMAKIFPDDVTAVMPVPPHLKIVPGVCFCIPATQTESEAA